MIDDYTQTDGVVWTSQDGTEWFYEACWEGCEYVTEPNDAGNGYCCRPVEYIGIKNFEQIGGLCGEHFEEMKNSSK